jgi:Domain of unknown function (DUF222)
MTLGETPDPAPSSGLPSELPYEGCPLTAAQLAEQEAILAEILAEDSREDPDEDPGEDRYEAWGEDPGEPGTTPPTYPDASRRDHTSPSGPGFASGSVLDAATPSPALAAALEDSFAAGLDSLSDDGLAGVILAARRCESRAAAQLLAAVAELHRRRAADSDHRVVEYADTELALLLTLTRRSAGVLLSLATALGRLPATSAALAEGRLHRAQAVVVADETELLEPDLAAAVEQLVIEDAPRLTTTRLRRRVRRAVLAADPAAARRRAEQARRDARVEFGDERSGATSALVGRDLPTAAALAADQRINAAARTLKAAGVPATLPQLRAAVFLSLLTDTDPLAFLPPPDDDGKPRSRPATDATRADGHTAPADHPESADPESADPESADPESADPESADPESPDPESPDPASADHPESADHPQPSRGQSPPADPGPPDTQDTGDDQAPIDRGAVPDSAAAAGGSSAASGAAAGGSRIPGSGLGVRGSVNLTLPLATWLGASLSPGDIAGLGPATAETAQDLADWIAENPGSRWCLTLTDTHGRALGHACARRPPPPPDDTQRLAEWLARLKPEPIQGGQCTHVRYVPGYRIPASLHHIVKIRQQTCSNPICVRPATHSDDDHTRAHDQGGITCECGLGPACRRCHQAKQAKGWRLEQPRPGEFIWQPPHGRQYPSSPDTYPT